MSARASHHGCRPSGRGTSAPRARARACVCSKAASCAERKKDVGHGIVCSSRVCGGCPCSSQYYMLSVSQYSTSLYCTSLLFDVRAVSENAEIACCCGGAPDGGRGSTPQLSCRAKQRACCALRDKLPGQWAQPRLGAPGAVPPHGVRHRLIPPR